MLQRAEFFAASLAESGSFLYRGVAAVVRNSDKTPGLRMKTDEPIAASRHFGYP